MPKKSVSVITINLNNESGLKKTIISVIEQTSRDFEFIVIDGGSSDGSIPVLKYYDKDIFCWISEKDEGVFYAMNKGIERATGEYLIFLNSGDIFFSVNVIKDFIELNTGKDLVYGNAYSIIKGKTQKWILPDNLNVTNTLTNTINHQSIFYNNRICNENIPYNTNYKIAADWIFTTENIIFNKASIQYINVDICICEPPGISSDYKERGRERDSYLKDTFNPMFTELLFDYRTLKNQHMDLKSRSLVKAYLLTHKVIRNVIKSIR